MSSAEHKRLVIRKPLLLLLSFDLMIGLLLELALKPSPFMGAWLLFTLILFTLGGWLFLELVQTTRGASPPMFLIAPPALILVWLPLSAIAVLGFLGAMTSNLFLRGRIARDSRLGNSLTLFLVALSAVGLVLLGMSAPTNVNPLILWGPAVAIGLAGWFFPEINRLIRQGPNAKLSRRSTLTYLLIIWVSILGFPVLGDAYRFSLLPNMLALMLFMLLRATIVGKGSSWVQTR